ncbi:DUF7144 family membrane protein [Streptomyces purpurogeneiscleroticus]|uniref:DUF7144 family membrane protein n=1 Tax=Streptomyces purpurogeneiscleroticus TaxID=68259 RepID=UPI001CBBF183|nr:hypothetical protein [Streptomyces purpurogeneiscleroticus]MBZ4020612.1 hypothetical protein [Streptomyces purpurogeneiscleroticus]
MSQAAPHAAGPKPPRAHGPDNVWAASGTLLAGVLMLVSGVLGVLEGIAGIAKNEVYLLSNELTGTYVYEFDTTAWGWIHLILGVIVAVTGLGLLKGAGWARTLGIVVAGLYVIAHFMWLPYQPVWATVGIALGIFVIWSLCTDRTRYIP